jgi:hypothetical protein
MDQGANKVNTTSAYPGPKVRVLHNGQELWRGPIRDFYRSNDMDSAAAHDIHKQLRKYGDAIVGGGAAADFMLVLSSEGDLKRDSLSGKRDSLGIPSSESSAVSLPLEK